MTSFDPKSVTYSKDTPLEPSSIEAKRAKVIATIDRWLQFKAGELPVVEGKKPQSPIWLSRLEGDKRHYRLKYAQRDLVIGDKGEDRLTVAVDVNEVEVFNHFKKQVNKGEFDKSILAISEAVKASYKKKK